MQPSTKRNILAVATVLSLGTVAYAHKDNLYKVVQSPSGFTTATAIPLSLEESNLSKISTKVQPAIYTISVGESQGSGVLIKPNLVVTNLHVLDGKFKGIKAQSLGQGHTEQSARLVQSVPELDLAFLEVDSGNIEPIPLAPSYSQPQIGEKVIALGDPLNIGYTLTTGILSGNNRKINLKGRTYSGLLQHTAFINPGSSGGALLNERGELVGINNAEQTTAQGIFFAIPADKVWGCL